MHVPEGRFRRFRIEDGILTINGKRIVFKGADRHEFDAERGPRHHRAGHDR